MKTDKKDFDTLVSGYEDPIKSIGKKVTFSLIVGTTISAVILLAIANAFRMGFNPSKVHWSSVVYSEKYQEKIFVNCLGFGVTGDHRIVKISHRIDKSFEHSKNEYFLEGFYNVSFLLCRDTLYICSEEEFEKPEKNDFKTTIVFNCDRTPDCGSFRKISPYQVD